MSYKFHFNCLKFSCIGIFMLFFHTSIAQTNFAALDKIIEEKKNIIGQDLVVVITKKDSVVYQKEFGGFKAKTVAPIASCSKWLTAALVMQFVDEGKLSLDDKITKYLPEFEKYGKNYITIRHCLSHLTGIKSDNTGNLLKILQRKKYATLQDEISDIAAKEIQSNPGTEFRYSEIGLNIAGRILEIISKKRFDLLIKQKLFNPLGMRQSTFSTIDGSAPNPSGSAKSTASDYTNFLKMLLNNGMFNGQRILSESAVAEMRKIQTANIPIKYAPRAAEGFQYALGTWVLEKDNNGTANAVASPGLFGTWPMVDYCRGYTCIFFVKSFLGEQKADAYLDIKKVIDDNFKSACK